MITYTTIIGDTVQRIAYKFQTTERQLGIDNPGLKNPIDPGTKVKIKTIKEIAQDNINNAMKNAEEKESKIDTIVANVQYADDKLEQTGVIFAGITTTVSQKGIVKWNEDGFIYQISSDDQLVKRDTVKKGGRYRYYNFIDKYGGVYVLGGTNAFAKASEVSKEDISVAILTRSTTKQEKQIQEDEVQSFTIPQFEMPGYKRTRMKIKKPDGTYLTIELRVTSFIPNYSSQITPNRTNAGWMTQIGGSNLTLISLQGFFLDTRANLEARQFMKLYKDILIPKNNADYFSVEVVSLLHKSWEYQGLIQSLSMPDSADTPLDRKFQMQFLSFMDKPISASDITKIYPDVVNRNGQSEADFRSDLGKMLSDPLSGNFKQDNL